MREEHRSPPSCVNPQRLVWKAAFGFDMWVPEEVCSQFSISPDPTDGWRLGAHFVFFKREHSIDLTCVDKSMSTVKDLQINGKEILLYMELRIEKKTMKKSQKDANPLLAHVGELPPFLL